MKNETIEDFILEVNACCDNKTVARENGKKFRIISKETFTRLKIDDCIIRSNDVNKCDYGFIRNTNGDFYFVELKGTDINHAYNQILSTINIFNREHITVPKHNRFGFIVSSRVPSQGVDVGNLKQHFRKNHGKELKVGSNGQLDHMP